MMEELEKIYLKCLITIEIIQKICHKAMTLWTKKNKKKQNNKSKKIICMMCN